MAGQSSDSLLLLDTNLLVVLVVAACEPDSIGRVKRTEVYTKDDAALIGSVVSAHRGILVTPHIITELSNLTGQIGGKLFYQIRDSLIGLIPQWTEYSEPSADIATDPLFRAFGITDAAIHRASREAFAVLTDDLPLYDTLGRRGVNVINFTHLRIRNLRETR